MERKNGFISYLIKALILFGILFVISRVSYNFDSFFVVIICIILSIPGALAIMYLTVLRKTSYARRYQEGGWLAWFNGKKTLGIIAAFFLSFFTTFLMFLEMPTWQFNEWIFVILLFPVYFIVYRLLKSFIEKEFKGYYAESPKVAWSTVLVPIVMCILYFVCDYFIFAKIEYQSLEEAFIAHENILKYSPSALVKDTAKLTSMFDAFYYYVIGRASDSFPIINAVWNLFIMAAIFGNITNILHCFMIPSAQLKRIVLPLTTDAIPDPKTPIQKRYIVLSVFLVFLSIIVFIMLDSRVDQINKSGHFTKIEEFVRDKMEITAAIIDDKYYEYEPVLSLIREQGIDALKFQEEAGQELIPLINKSFDARIANVDLYLDWYYSLPADYSRLANLVIGNIENHLEQKLRDHLENGIDDLELEEKLDYFARQAEQLIERFRQELERFEINPAIPEWLIQVKSVMSISDFFEPLKPAKELMDYRVRLGISGVAGVAAGVVTRQLIIKLISKQFFQRLVAKVIASAAGGAAGRGAGAAAGAATGAAIGTAGGPVGTIIGGIIGAIVGTAVGLGVQYALLNIDEALNRDDYRNEIIETIEEQRRELLALLL